MADALQIERLDQGVLCLRGPLTLENVPPFQNAVRRERAATVIFDLSGVPYVDSSGLGSLVAAYVSCVKAGRRVALTGVNAHVLKQFHVTKVESLFLIFPTLDAALQALSTAGNA